MSYRSRKSAFIRMLVPSVSAARIEVPHAAAFDFSITDPFSLGAWFRIGPTASGAILVKIRDSSQLHGYALRITSGELIFVIRGTGGLNAKLQGQSTLRYDNDAWHHAAFSYDGSGVLAGCRLYADGGLVTLKTTTNAFSGTLENTFPVTMGNNHLSSASFNGYLDECAIWNKALSAGEVADAYNAGIPPDLTTLSTAGDLVGYWPIGDGGDVWPAVADVSGNGHNGTCTGRAKQFRGRAPGWPAQRPSVCQMGAVR